MKTVSFLALLLAGLSGCATRTVPPAHGSFLPSTGTADYDQRMAKDVVQKLVALYPPARTRFNLQHAAPDAFGSALVDTLRAKGYALAEFKPGAADTSAPSSADLSMTYVVDQPLDAGLYRVTVQIDKQSLSRLYQGRDGALAPAGYWVRKE